MQKNSFLFWVGLICLLLTVLFSGYKYYQKSLSEQDLIGLSAQNEALIDQYNALDAGNTENLFSAKKVLDKLDASSLKWSKVIKDIVRTVPLDAKGNALVDILAYSGAGGSELSLNVSTIPGSTKPYFDVADFIAAFDSSARFVENFVPSIASGINAEGKEILSFSFSTKYVEESITLLTR